MFFLTYNNRISKNLDHLFACQIGNLKQSLVLGRWGNKLLPTVKRNIDGFPGGKRDLARCDLSFLK